MSQFDGEVVMVVDGVDGVASEQKINHFDQYCEWLSLPSVVIG